MNYRIIVDATADLTENQRTELEESGIVKVIPLHLSKPDLEKLELYDFYQYLREHPEEPVKTSSATMEEAYAAGWHACEEGLDVIYLPMASALSTGAYRAAKTAADHLQRNYPGRKVTVIDSCCVAPGLGLLVRRAAEMRLEYDELVRYLRHETARIIHLFSLSEFDTLLRGGRFSEAKSSMLLGKLARGLARGLGWFVKILLGFYIGRRGVKALLPLGICLGGERSLARKYVRTARKFGLDEADEVVLAFGDRSELVHRIYVELVERYGEKLPRVTWARIGPVVGAHVGGSVTAMFFRGTRPLEK